LTDDSTDTPPPRHLSPSGEVETVPAKLQADFAPPPEATDDDTGEGEPHYGNSLRVREAYEAAERAADAGDSSEAARHYLKASNLAEQAREWYFAAVSCQRVGDILQSGSRSTDLEQAVRMHRRAVAAYVQCGLYDEARRLSYRLLVLKMRRAPELNVPWTTRVELTIYWATAGFGFRPLRVIAWAVSTVVAFGVLYWAPGGAVISGGDHRPATFGECVYFSGITYATVGYGDIVPAPHMRMCALVEGAVGIFTMSFLVVVLANRLRH
jgi:hypothetical protein